MFKNRHAEVKIVKDKKEENYTVPWKLTPVELQQMLLETGKEVTKGAAVLISTYVAADTLRRVVVHIVATKI